MLYFLSDFSNFFGPLRLFEYVTFRAGAAAFTAFLIVACFGARFASMLRRMNMQAASRYDGIIPAELLDKRKNGTPCMGGILLIGASLLSSLLWLRPDGNGIGWILYVGTLGFALIGFIDDYRKVFYKERDGLKSRWKFLLLLLLSALIVTGFRLCGDLQAVMQEFYVPFIKRPVAVGAWWLPVLSVLVLVGTSNAVNLTDGKDGLASGCTIFCTMTYAVFAYLMGHQVFATHLNIPFISGIEEAVVFAAAIGGGCIGFLWHNCHPASMFMGDTGSLALGGATGMLAVLSRQELLLVIVGGVFVMEAGSVVLQVASMKLTKKRIFRCTPIHHHFEPKWTETQIVVRFWILSGIFALSALATLKLR